MSLWVKICANTSLEDALLAADAGANAVGFVFAPSPRRVTVEQVATIVPGLPKSIEKIGVFVDASPEEIAATVRAGGLTGAQVHSDAGADAPARLRAEFRPELRILRVVHFGQEVIRQAAEYARDANVDAVLVDSRTATAVGGTGIAFDWDAARGTVFSEGGGVKLVAAGGLNPENVAEEKDAAKVRAFLERARRADL